MVYTIIAEARTGGSHLVEALNKELPHFQLAAEPWNGAPNNFTDSNDVTQIDWINNYENIIIKEIYTSDRNFSPLINRSDKVFCIFRENWYAQLRSTLYHQRFDEWQWSYKKTDMDSAVSEEEIYDKYHKHYKSNKKHFQDFIKRMNLPSISYEKLYFQNGVSEVKEIFNLNDSFEFPIYERHLKDDEGHSIGYEPTPNERRNLI